MGLLKQIKEFLGLQVAVEAPGERIDLGINLGFEGPFRNVDGIGELFVAEGWHPWHHWRDTRPEFKRATRQDAPGNRVKEGEFAQQWFNSYAKSVSGIYQRVEGVPQGALLVLTAWVMVWTCDDRTPPDKSNGRMYMRIGIDPYGGTDPDSGDIVWSDGGHSVQPYDAYVPLGVETVAKSDRVTLWIWSMSEWGMANNNAYVDGVEFYALGVQPQPPPEPVPEERVREIANEEIAKSFKALADQAEVIATGVTNLVSFLRDMLTTGWTPVEDVKEDT